MKIKFYKLIDLYEALNVITKLSETPGAISSKVVIEVSRFILKVEDDASVFYKTRQLLNRQYGVEIANIQKDVKGEEHYIGSGTYFIHPENREKYASELDEILQKEIEVPDLNLTEEDLNSIKDLSIASRVMILRALQKPE